ncbi:MAG: hypothetical protein ACLS8R_06085 [Anaeromassilibacillus sp.]
MRFLGRWKELYCGCSDQESARICTLWMRRASHIVTGRNAGMRAAASGWMRFGSFGKYPPVW